MFKDFVHRAISPLVYNAQTAIVPRRLQPLWPERIFLRSFLALHEIDCVVDVGANAGQFASELRLLGYKGLILSFEPDPVTFRKLSRRRAKDLRWLAFNHALGANTSSATMNLMADSVYNSFHNPSTQETDLESGGNTVMSQVEVPIARLDEVFNKIGATKDIKKIHLKMDTQGFDLEVFRGCQRLMNLIKTIQSEIPLKRIYEGTPHWREILTEYENAGFEINSFFRVNPHRTRTNEMDCFMLKSE